MDEEFLALASKGKGKSKKKGSRSRASGKKKSIDFSKVKCFNCHKLGHFTSQCPEKKKCKPQMEAPTGVEEFCQSFEKDFFLVACMSNLALTDVWYVDSGTSCHMTGRKEFFSRLQEGGVNILIELGDNARYNAQGIGTVSFQRESGKPLCFVDVLYVLGLTKNLISLSTLEDKGFEVTFCMFSSAVTDVWYVDSGASCHMTGRKKLFSRLQEGGVNIHIELGDNARYKAQGIGTLSFQRESRKPLRFVDVLYVPGLTKNLISVSTLEDKGFEVTFRGEKVYIRPKGSIAKMDKVIGVHSDKVYRLHFEPVKALVSSSTDLGESWHRWMGHLHFGALGHLR
jgi:hypothetical protein